MEVSKIIAELDLQISKLQQARALLAGSEAAPVSKPGRGRPKGSKNATTKAAAVKTPAVKTKGKRQLSPEGRKAIAEAMKRRWAERRKAA